MTDPINIEAPDDSGSVTLVRYDYQVHAALQFVIPMFAGARVRSVTCEHIEDVLIELAEPAESEDSLWDFMQVKTRDTPEPWTLSAVFKSGPLKSLWRTHVAVREAGLRYRLTAVLEGLLDPADVVQALARGQGAENGDCLDRVVKHLKCDAAAVTDFLRKVTIRTLPRRGDIENANLRALGELGPKTRTSDLEAIYNEVARLAYLATQGRLGQSWQLLSATSAPAEKVLRKRLTQASLTDLRQRLVRPDHILLRAGMEDQASTPETALVRKMRRGGASDANIESAQMLRANADSHQLDEMARNMWPDDPGLEGDLDNRLLIAARSAVGLHQSADQPANAIFDELLNKFTVQAAAYDRHPLFGADGMLLLGRACGLSDQCHFAWGEAHA